MVVVPVDAQKHEAQHVTQEDRDQRPQIGQIGAMRRVQFQHHDGDEMAITPSLNASMRFLLIVDPDADHHIQMPGLTTSSRVTS